MSMTTTLIIIALVLALAAAACIPIEAWRTPPRQRPGGWSLTSGALLVVALAVLVVPVFS